MRYEKVPKKKVAMVDAYGRRTPLHERIIETFSRVMGPVIFVIVLGAILYFF